METQVVKTAQRVMRSAGAVDHNDPEPLHPEESPSPWISTSGTIAHPESPMGAGGPGFFRNRGPVGGPGDRTVTHLHPATLTGRGHLLKMDEKERLETSKAVPAKKNKAPVTKTKEKKIKKTIKKKIGKKTVSTKIDVTISILADVDKDAEIPEGTAHTEMNPGEVAPEFPNITTDLGSKKVTGEDGTVTFKGTITIRTHYRDKADANKKSAYGRGTTKEDIESGDVTVGFHEKCHRDDWWTYLTTKDFPAFTGHVGMTETEYTKAQDQLDSDWEAYIEAGNQNTYDLTDDVGDPTEAEHSRKI